MQRNAKGIDRSHTAVRKNIGRAFAQQLLALTPPDVQSDEARQLLANVMSMLLGVIATLEAFGTDQEAASAAG